MASENFTGDVRHKIYENVYCSAELLTEGLYSHHITLAVFNIFLSITTFLGNTLILAALHKESSLHPPSKLLLSSLAATDLCVGLIVEPLAVTERLSLVSGQWDICRISRHASFITSYILCSVSFLTMTAISVDRLLALLLGLRYRQVVTLKRTYAVILAFWVVSIVGTTLSIWNNAVLTFFTYIGTCLCLGTSICSYTKIFFTLRHRQHQVQNSVPVQPRQGITLNIARYKKAVYSAMWVQLALVICYLPYNLLVPLTNSTTWTKAIFLTRQVTSTLIYVNSSINPILYCWKIREVRQAVKETLTHVFGSSG